MVKAVSWTGLPKQELKPGAMRAGIEEDEQEKMLHSHMPPGGYGVVESGFVKFPTNGASGKPLPAYLHHQGKLDLARAEHRLGRHAVPAVNHRLSRLSLQEEGTHAYS